MNEALRLDYLQAMGVDSYVPRFVLEGAAASPLCEMEFLSAEYDETESGTAERYDSDSDGNETYDIESEYQSLSGQRDSQNAAAPLALEKGQNRSRIASELEGLNLDGKSQARPAPLRKDDPDAVANGAQANPAFNVDLVGTGIGVLFVADTSAKPLNPAEKRLLANIAFAIKTHRKLDTAPTFSSAKFQWPVLKTSGFAQGENAAKDALLGNVMAHAERQNAQCVIVFGDEIKAYFDQTILSSAGLAAIFSAAPAAMLEDGGLKASLWQQLRSHSFISQGAE